jgi:hypothetical protein
MWPFDLLPATAQRIITVIFYAAIALGCAWFAVITSRKPAPTRARETFRTPGRIGARGYLLFASAAVVVAILPQSAPAWQTVLLVGWLAAGIAVTWTGHRMYSRAADAYPAGKHADPATPPESRWPLKRRSQR